MITCPVPISGMLMERLILHTSDNNAQEGTLLRTFLYTLYTLLYCDERRNNQTFFDNQLAVSHSKRTNRY